MNAQLWRVNYGKVYRTGKYAGTLVSGVALFPLKQQAEEYALALGDGQERMSTYPRGKYRVAPGTVHIRGLL